LDESAFPDSAEEDEIVGDFVPEDVLDHAQYALLYRFSYRIHFEWFNLVGEAMRPREWLQPRLASLHLFHFVSPSPQVLMEMKKMKISPPRSVSELRRLPVLTIPLPRWLASSVFKLPDVQLCNYV
jgi:hypothetical protein